MRAARALAIVIAACGDREPTPPSPAPVTLAPTDVVTVAEGTVETGPYVAGTLEAARSADVRAQVGGTVRSVGPELGDRVAAGERLARSDRRALAETAASARAQVRAATRELALAERELARTRALVDAGALARRELETAQARVSTQRAALDRARAERATTGTQLADADVRAPMAGVVEQRAIHVGDVVAPGALLYRIVDPSSIRFEAGVPSEQVGLVTVGAPVRFAVRGYPSQSFTGEVARVAPAANPTTRQLEVIVTMANPGERLLAGLFARGQIIARAQRGLIVPIAAIDTRSGKPTVLRVSRGAVELVPVTLGLRDSMTERVIVVAGLAAGDVIAARAAAAPAPETPVRLPTS